MWKENQKAKNCRANIVKSVSDSAHFWITTLEPPPPLRCLTLGSKLFRTPYPITPPPPPTHTNTLPPAPCRLLTKNCSTTHTVLYKEKEINKQSNFLKKNVHSAP